MCSTPVDGESKNDRFLENGQRWKPEKNRIIQFKNANRRWWWLGDWGKSGHYVWITWLSESGQSMRCRELLVRRFCGDQWRSRHYAQLPSCYKICIPTTDKKKKIKNHLRISFFYDKFQPGTYKGMQHIRRMSNTSCISNFKTVLHRKIILNYIIFDLYPQSSHQNCITR